MKANDILREAATIYEQRNKVYGDNYLRVGKVMEAHFPDGLFVRTADDWNRLHLFLSGVVKDTRYVTNWNIGGHADSSRDSAVYSAMLEEIDLEIKERPEASTLDLDTLAQQIYTLEAEKERLRDALEDANRMLADLAKGLKE